MRMKAPAGMETFSHGGVTHVVTEDGYVEVNSGAIAELKAHGLVPAPPSAEQPPAIPVVGAFQTFMAALAEKRKEDTSGGDKNTEQSKEKVEAIGNRRPKLRK